jgi:hypothetical protein
MKIQQLLIIMQYLSDIGDNPVHTYGACMYTSVLMTDLPLLPAAMPLLLLLYLLPMPHCLKKDWILVITVRMEGKKQHNGLST